MHRRAERHDAGPVGLSCAGLYWGIDVLTAARVHSAMQAPRHGAGVACIERGRMHAHLKRPAAHSCCGHVTGPAPQGRPSGCTRRARAVILSPVSPCGANYYRNRVQLNTRYDIVLCAIASKRDSSSWQWSQSATPLRGTSKIPSLVDSPTWSNEGPCLNVLQPP